MKKKFLLALIVLFSFLLIPVSANAKDKATVYLFRGKGCTYCRALLTFLNDNNDEIGNYYELKAFEVWNDSDNSELMTTISTFLNQPAQGVPYLIIGDKVFPGYYDGYNDEIISTIKKLYETDKSKRYDVFDEYGKSNKLTKKYKSLNLKEVLKEEGIKYNEIKKSSSGTSSKWVIIWNFVFTLISTLIIITFINKKFKQLNENIKKSTTTSKPKTSKK